MENCRGFIFVREPSTEDGNMENSRSTLPGHQSAAAASSRIQFSGRTEAEEMNSAFLFHHRLRLARRGFNNTNTANVAFLNPPPNPFLNNGNGGGAGSTFGSTPVPPRAQTSAGQSQGTGIGYAHVRRRWLDQQTEDSGRFSPREYALFTKIVR